MRFDPVRMIDAEMTGRNIAYLRRRRMMTQLQLSEAVNVSHQAVSKWERGAALPDVETILVLSRLFCVSMEALLLNDLTGLEDIEL